MRVIVSGAGVGGLTAAQGLLAAGHEVVVLERGELSRGGHSGYRLRLDRHAVRTLERLLPTSVWVALLGSTSGGTTHHRLTYLDQHLRPLGIGRDEDREVAMIGRGPLLRLLAHGVDAHVHERWEAESFRVGPDTVSVTSTDGRVETGDLVVVAEGAHSRLRRQLLGDTGSRPLGIGAVSARVPGRTADHGLAGITGVLAHGYALATGRGGIGLFLSAHDPALGPALDPAAVGPVAPDLEDPYLIWALLGTDAQLPAPGAPAGVLRAAVERLTGTWHRDVARLPRLSDPTSLQRFALHAAPPVPTWPTTAVTLLGDAIHVVPPTGGVGASTAIRDAGNLVEALAGAGDRPGVLRGIRRYEHLMRSYADEVVDGSVAPLRWQRRLSNPALYSAVTGVRAATFALTGRSIRLPSRN